MFLSNNGGHLQGNDSGNVNQHDSTRDLRSNMHSGVKDSVDPSSISSIIRELLYSMLVAFYDNHKMLPAYCKATCIT